MSALEDVDQLIERDRRAVGELLKGNPEPVKKLFSHREDVSLANPYGPPVRGWEQVAEVLEHAASQVRDGEVVDLETVAKYVTSELAYVVLIERVKAKVGGREDITPWALRATMIFRPEDGTWKIVHRHADPITTPQPLELENVVLTPHIGSASIETRDKVAEMAAENLQAVLQGEQPKNPVETV